MTRIGTDTNTEAWIMPEMERKLIESMSSQAALLGKALFYYGRTVLNITFDQYEETEKAFAATDPDDSLFTLAEDPGKTSKTTVKETGSPGQQYIQLLTLLHPDVKKALGTSSAIYQIFSNALSYIDRKGETLEEQIDGMNLVTLAGFWIITRRVFALGHSNDCFKIIDALLDATKEGKPLNKLNKLNKLTLAGISDSDHVNVSAFYDAYCASLSIGINWVKEKTEPVEDNVSAAVTKLEPLTEIINTDKIIMSTSIAARSLLSIAEKETYSEFDVGRGAKIQAKITGKNGEKIVFLTRLDYDVMEAVGQIFMENGFKVIIITPEQIFRKITCTDTTATISRTAIEEIIESMDKLITTPAALNYKEQIEKHTRLKAKPYGNRQGILKGNLISGMHMVSYTTTYKGRLIEHAFKIYDLPMFVYYSYSIGQLTTIPAHYLTGTLPPVPGQKKTTPKKGTRPRLTLKEAGLRKYLLEEIQYTKKLKENRDKKMLYRKQTPPKTYKSKLAFSTIAEKIKYEVDTEKRKRTIREQVFNFMQEQVAMGNIISCEYYYIGRAQSGIEITV